MATAAAEWVQAMGGFESAGRAVYRQIADELRAAIAAGEYGEGGALPSETDLAGKYHVTRMTARHAVDVLKLEGLVVSEHGRGVFVRRRPVVVRMARNRIARGFREPGRGAFEAEMRALGLEPSVELAKVGPGAAPKAVRERLGLSARGRTLVRRRRMYASGHPMLLATSYVPWELAAGTRMVEHDTGPGGLYSRLADQGHRPARFTEEVSARPASPEEARFFGVPPGQPVLELVRTAFDEAGRAVEVSEQVLAADRWQLMYDWLAE